MKRVIVSGSLLVIVLFTILTCAYLINFYRASTNDARLVTTAFARTIERVLSSDLRGIAVALDSFASASEGDVDLSSDATLQALERMEESNSIISRTTIIDEDGNAVHVDDLLPSGEIRFSGTEYFRFHKGNNNNEIYMDGPLAGRLGQRPYATLSRRLNAADGSFRGVVVAAIDLESYGAGLVRLEARPIDVIAIFRDNAIMLLRVPDPLGAAGKSFSGYPLFSEHLKSADAGFYLASAQSDGVTRYAAFTRVAGFPLIVAVTISMDTVVEQWRTALVYTALAGLILTIGVGSFAWLAIVERRNRAEAEQKFSETFAELASAGIRHRSLFDALPANVALIDANGSIIDINSNWRDYGQRNSTVGQEEGRGANYLDVCGRAAASGDQDAARVAEGLRTILAGGPQRFEMDYPCHSPREQRWYHLTLAPIDLGGRLGAVAMHFDVTARKLSELSLVDAQSRMRRLAEGVPGVVFQLRLDDGGVVHWSYLSDRCRGLFGMSAHDALEGGDLLANILSGDELTTVSSAVCAHMKDGHDLDCEFRVRRPDGEFRSVRAVARAGDSSSEHISDGILLDVTVERDTAASLTFISSHDALTGLLNRTEFLRRLDAVLRQPREGDGGIAVHVVSVDDFGDIGDAYGMEVGDAALCAVAGRLAETAEVGSVVARISGERFAVLQQKPGDVNAAATFAETVLAKARQPLDVPGQTVSFSVSIGIARPAQQDDSAAIIIISAERALRRARKSGRGTYRFDEQQSGLETQTRLTLKAGLARALANGEFVLHYQPRVRLSDGVVTGCEALLRWQHPVFGMQSPLKFIPVAEQSGQIVQIGRWVLQEACRQAKQWLDAGNADLRIAVNLSAVQVTQSDIVATVEAILTETGLPASALELEMTEAVAFDQALRGQFNRLHALGVSIAIDDFGTGFSSLGTLRSFPLDILKIDQSFVRKALEVAADRVVVATVVDLARGLQLTTVAEGVETIEQAVFLRSLGCDEIQGYYIAMPLEAADFGWFLETSREHVQRKLRPLFADSPRIIDGG